MMGWLRLWWVPVAASALVQTGAPVRAPVSPQDADLLARIRRQCPVQRFAAIGPAARPLRPRDAEARDPFDLGEDDALDEVVNTARINRALNQLADGRGDLASVTLCEVLEFRVKTFGISSWGVLAIANNLGVILRKTGRGSEARALLEAVLAVAQSIIPVDDSARYQGSAAMVSVRTNLASALYDQGQLVAAADVLRSELKASHLPGWEESESFAIVNTNLGQALTAQGRLSEAESYLRTALDARRTKDPESQETAASLNDLGANLSAQGRLADGERLLTESLAIRTALFGEDHLNTAFTDSNLAANLLAQGRPAEALPRARSAWETREARLGATHPDRTAALTLLGTIELASGDASEALEDGRKALAARLAHSALEKADPALQTRGAKFEHYFDPAKLVTRAAWQALPAANRAWRLGGVSPLAEEAFVAAQRSAWSSAGDAIARAAARRAANDRGLGALAAAIETARSRVEQSDAAVVLAASSTEPDGGARLARLRGEQANAHRALNQASAALRTRFPTFFEFLHPEPIGLAGVQNSARPLLDDDEVLIFMTPGHGSEHGFIWAIARDRAAWAEIGLPATELNRLIRRLRLIIDPKGARSGDASADALLAAGARGYERATAYKIYSALFGQSDIASIVNAKARWMIVPQGSLVAAPFVALVTAEPEGGPEADVNPAVLRRTAWLGLDHALTLLPTVSSLNALRGAPARAAVARLPFFGLGDPSFAGGDAPLQEAGAYYSDADARLADLRRLPALPGTRREIELLAGLLHAQPGDALLGTKASETLLGNRPPSRELSRYAILAFATHGLLTGNLGGTLSEPALALSPPMSAGPDDDGLLTASEAAQMHLNADWVLLSACNSAAGGAESAEGLTGLARAFLLAGARAVLVSHWRVRDDAAPRITGRTIELMSAARLRRSVALQHAMRELMMDGSMDVTGASFASPSAWAAFTVVGAD